jgi:arylformamidase
MKRILLPAFVLVLLFTAGSFAQEQKWIDITAPLDPKTTPVYPGDAPIQFKFLKDMRSGDALTLSSYTLGAHSGTHLDAPMHFIKGGATIDQLSPDVLIGKVRVIDCSPDAMAVDAAELNKHEWKGAERILFRTRNSRNKWMHDPNFHKDFTYVAPDAAQLMADNGVKLVGIDYISMEQFGAKQPKTHQTLLGKGIPIAEGVDLSDVQAGDYQMIMLPLKIVGHEASPVRALLQK